MNYYEHHIGDYQKKTAHLSLVEHGVYFLMMQAFYATEKPLPEGKVLYRIVRAESKAERSAVDTIVRQFWRKTPDGLTNKRAKEHLDEYREFLDKQRASGRAGADKRWGRNSDANGVTTGGAIATPLPTPIAPTSHSHLPGKNPTPTPPKGGADRHRRISPDRAEKDAALEVWNRLVASSGAEPPRDSKLQAAIDRVGGWPAIEQRTPFEEPRLRSAFCDAYRGAGQ